MTPAELSNVIRLALLRVADHGEQRGISEALRAVEREIGLMMERREERKEMDMREFIDPRMQTNTHK